MRTSMRAIWSSRVFVSASGSLRIHDVLHCAVPRVNCPDHGVVTAHVPWTDGLTGFTMMFETWAIGWLSDTTMSAWAAKGWAHWIR